MTNNLVNVVIVLDIFYNNVRNFNGKQLIVLVGVTTLESSILEEQIELLCKKHTFIFFV